MLVLFFLQVYWLSNLYQIHKIEYYTVVNDELNTSIKKELTIRNSHNFEDPQNPRFVIKAMEDMTPEEIERCKGDTIVLKKAERGGIGNNIADLIAQSFQDGNLVSNPIKLGVLDSIYRSQLKEKGIFTPVQLFLHNKHKVATDSTQSVINKQNSYRTSLFPIGTQALLFVSAYVEIPPSLILQRMLYALVVSFLMTIIIFYSLYYQLIVIKRTTKTLLLREQAVHAAIHDLKAPLNTTYTILDYMAHSEKDNAKKQTLQTGKAHVRMLTDTIESMLDFIKKKERTETAHTEINLPALIEQLHSELSLIYPAKKYQFNLNNQLPYTYIYTDKVRLERCLRNLLENALKYSDDGVQIAVSLTNTEAGITIAIQDTGWGIPQQVQKKISTQFFRAEHIGKEKRPGYGIGLSSVKLLAEEMGGIFKFQSEEGSGSTFFIILPPTNKRAGYEIKNSIC